LFNKDKSLFENLYRARNRFVNFRRIFSYIVKQSLTNALTTHVYTATILIAGGILQVIALLQITLLLKAGSGSTGIASSLPLPLWFKDISIPFMVGVALITGTFLIAALCTYSGESRVLKLATDLEETLIKNFLNFLATREGLFTIIRKQVPIADLYILLLSSPRLAGRILRLQFALIQPVLKSTVLLVALLVLDWQTTLAVVGLLIILSIAQYKVNIRAVRYSRQFNKSNKEVKRFLKPKIGLAITGNDTVRGITDDISENELYKQNKLDYRMRLQVTEESKLASNVTKAAIVLLLLTSATNFGQNLSVPVLTSLLSYALILVFFLISVQATLACLTSMSRFYSRVSLYFKFIYGDDCQQQLSKEDMYVSVLSKDQQLTKVYLNTTTTLFVKSQQKNLIKTHISLLRAIQIENKGPAANLIKSETNNKEQKLSDSTFMPYTFIDENSSLISNLGLKENKGLQIIYISPEFARRQKEKAMYELSNKEQQLIPWPNKRNSQEELLDDDDDDDD
jgi:ABC-type multidrug transport system fused ATPase/permease subunit